MGFWFFMVAMTLLTPAVMLWFGYRFNKKGAPKQINCFFGYRTERSMKNLEIWTFAHRRCGAYWWKAGWITLVVSVVVMIFFTGQKIETVSTAGLVVVLLQLLPLGGAFFVTEVALRREFDQNGHHIAKK